jgi:hypothetical protein
MAIIKSSSDHIVINADGASKDIKFQANGVEKASISSAGAFTSTTIDATVLTGNLPAISGASLTNLPGGGKVLQVVNSISTTAAVISSGSYVSTGITGTITPTLASSTLLVLVNIGGVAQSNGYSASQPYMKLYRDINGGGYSAMSNSERTVSGLALNSTTSVETTSHGSMVYEDSPSTTSVVSFRIYMKVGAGNYGLNYNSNRSSITIMEVSV